MKTKLLFYLFLFLGLSSYSQINVSTGVDASGNALPNSSIDPFWKITNSPNPPATPAIVQSPWPGNWETTPVAQTNAQWINSTGSFFSTVGVYTFERSFNVPNGSTSLNYNLSISWDDILVSLELVKPDLTTIPLTVVQSLPLNLNILSLPITNTISNPASGVWKIRAVVNFTDPIAGFILSGKINFPSQIQSSQCGTMIPTLATTLRANWVTGATNYRFRITRVDASNMPITGIFAFQSSPLPNGTNNIALCNVPGIVYDANYRIEVEVQLNNVWQNSYGPPCTITTPNPISTIGAQCGTTLTAMNQWITTTIVPYVTSYRFRVTQLDGSLNPIGIPQIITTPHPSGLNKFNMTQSPLTGILYGTTYRVEVALRNTDGTYLPYNTGCNITTPAFPTSEVQASQCDYNALSFSETIIASTVTPATEYRFLLYNTTLGYSFSKDRFVPNFTLSLFPGLLLGTTYSVQVAVKINGVWGPYGKICGLTTPAVYKMNVSNSNDFAFKAVAYPNPFASSFLIDVKTASEAQIQYRVYDMLGKLVEDKTLDSESLSALEIGSTYPTGIYNIIITQENNSSSLRVIKR